MAAINPWGVTTGPSYSSRNGDAVQPTQSAGSYFNSPTTFSTMQKQGIARPPSPASQPAPAPAPVPGVTPQMYPRPTTQPPVTAPQPSAPQSAPQSAQPDIMSVLMQHFTQGRGATPLGNGIYGQIMSSLANPSAYGADEAQKTFDRLNSRLSEGYDVERQKIKEEMARRGLSDSTIYGGRLGDVAIQQGRAQSDLAEQIAEQQALRAQQDRASAIQQALGYQGLLNDQGQQDFQNLFNFGQQSFNNQLASAGLNNQLQQQQVQMLLQLLGAV